MRVFSGYVESIDPNPTSDSTPISRDAMLLDLVRDSDVPCPLCGYNLRGLTVPRCPECGQGLKVSIALAEPYLTAWLALCIATCVPAGIGMMVWIVVLREGIPPFREAHLFAAAAFFYVLAVTPVVVAVLAARRRLLRLSRSAQWGLALGPILADIFCFVFFLSEVFR